MNSCHQSGHSFSYPILPKHTLHSAPSLTLQQLAFQVNKIQPLISLYCHSLLALIKMKTKFSSYRRKFRWDRLQSHYKEGLPNMWGNAQKVNHIWGGRNHSLLNFLTRKVLFSFLSVGIFCTALSVSYVSIPLTGFVPECRACLLVLLQHCLPVPVCLSLYCVLLFLAIFFTFSC